MDHMVPVCLIFKVIANYFPKWMYHFTFPMAVYEHSNFSNYLPGLGMVLNFSHSSRYAVALICIVLMICDV